jgi:peptidase M50B-like protein
MQDPLSLEMVGLIGLGAFAAVAINATWQIVRHFTVMAHEGAHAVLGSLMGRGIDGVTINTKAEGGTNVGPGSSLGSVVIGFAGYMGPSAFGLGAAGLINLGHSAAVLWVMLFLLALLLLALRRSFGILTVILAGALVFLVGFFAPMQAQAVAGYAITWLLLLSGVRRIVEVGLKSQDGIALRGLTHIPHIIWSLLWLAGSFGALIVGAKLLIMST